MSHRLVARLTRRGPERLLVLLGLGAFVTGAYVVIVLGGGLVVGHTDSPSLLLSVLATATVALMFAPVQAALERVATRSGHEGTSPPYDVLSRFSATVTGDYAAAELPTHMARLLAQGTGAQWAQVWLRMADQMTLAAAWPVDAATDPVPPSLRPGARDSTAAGRRALGVHHGGELLGVLRLQERPGLALTSVEERLFSGLAAQAGLALRLLAVRAELGARHGELVVRAQELQASRERLIETQDAERRRLERDIHDGAQQHLVALAVNLRLTETVAQRSPERAAAMLLHQAEAARTAIETLVSLAHGIYPRLLSDEGLGPALRAAVSGSPIPVSIETAGAARLSPSVEAALYFCCMEAVQNAAKHSGGTKVAVRLSEARGTSQLVVADDGTGFDPAGSAPHGAGLANMRDRLDAVGGTVTVASSVGAGTTVTAVVSGRAA